MKFFIRVGIAYLVWMYPLANLLWAQTAFNYDSPGNVVVRTNIVAVVPPAFKISLNYASADSNGLLSVCAPVTGIGPFAYQWLFNGTAILGATNDCFQVLNTSATNLGSYQLVVTNSAGSVTSAVVNVSFDSDHNGLPDAWELAYFGHLGVKPSADADGDGISNYNEYLDGTNPNNPTSFMPRLNLSGIGGGYVSASPQQAKYALSQVVQLTALPNAGQSFIGWFGSITDTNNPASLVMDGSKQVTGLFGLPLPQAVDATNLVWSTGGNMGWFGQSVTAYDGIGAAQSGPVLNNQQAWIETTITNSTRAVVTFWWRVSSYPGNNFLRLYLNGVLVNSLSGESGWLFQSCALLPGTNTLHWVYSKGVQNNSSQDCAWLDQVSVVPFDNLFAWSDDSSGQAIVPPGLTNLTAIAGGGFHSLALKSDGTVIAWGDNSDGQLNVPAGLSNVVAIAGGGFHSLALKSDGTVAAWGDSSQHATIVPTGLTNVVAVAAGWEHSLALKANGTVVGWGYNGWGQTTIPQGLSNVVAVAAGWGHSMALKSDGTVVAWGYGRDGQTSVPPGLANVAAIAAGWDHNLALRNDGTVIAWGDNGDNQTNVPSGLAGVIAVAGGGYHSLALKGDGTMTAWGDDSYGQIDVPWGLSNIVAIAAGGFHSMALLDEGFPLIVREPYCQTVSAGTAVNLSVIATTGTPLSYQWRFNGTNIVGATNATLTLTDVQTTNAGAYTVVVSNARGIILSIPATLTIVPCPPVIIAQPSNEFVFFGDSVAFAVVARGTEPMFYQWQLNGVNLAGATNSTVIITNVQPQNLGNYAVVITSSAGRVTSQAAGLTASPPPVCVTPPTGLAAWWPGDGTANDLAGANNGTLQGGAGFAPGKVGSAFSFDGVSGYVATTLDVQPSMMPTATWEAWVYPTRPNYGNRQQILSGDSGGYGRSVSIEGGTGNFGVFTGSGVWQAAPVSFNQWQHIAVVFAPDHIEFYKDGQQSVWNLVPTGQSSQNKLNIGRNPSGSEYFQGLIDEVSIYNRALSPTEILGIYEASSAGKCMTSIPPAIAQQPQDSFDAQGMDAVFSVVAGGSHPLYYQWFFNGTNLINGARISGANSGQLTIAGIQAADAGEYRVLVTNSLGAVTSRVARLTVAPPSSVVWLNPAGGSWSNPANWSFGAVPSPTNHIFIMAPGAYTVTLDVDTTVADLTVAGPSGNQTLTIPGRTLTLNGVANISNNLMMLNGGTIRGGTVMATSGGGVVSSGSGTLDGVSLVGVLDVGRSVNGASLTVTNGLVLNGTVYVGDSVNGWYGRIDFLGSQSLSGNGTVLFGNSSSSYYDYYNALRLGNAGTSLTLAPGITVRGQYGTIGYAYPYGGPQNVGIINQGAIWADVGGGTIKINGQPFNNQGVIGGTNGGNLVVGGTFTNSGNLGGPVALSGLWDNRSGQVVIGGTGALTINGGTILGGTVVATNGMALVASGSGTLDGVSVVGVLDVGQSVNGAALTVTNGLVLNGTAYVGNLTNYWYGRLDFLGSQSLSGHGTVVFGNAGSGCNGDYYNALRLPNDGTSLTLGSGITVRGQYGTIGYDCDYGGPQNVVVTNQGAILADVVGGTIKLNAQPFQNLGSMATAGGVFSGGVVKGAITVTNGRPFAIGSLMLDGVTFNGVLDVGSTVNGAVLTVTNGLVLNGTAYVGHPSMSWYGRIDFLGSQTLSGNGTVVFGNYSYSYCGDYYNALRVLNAGTSLTLGSGITVRGQYGTIGYDCMYGGPQNVGVVNQGAIWADMSSGTIRINGQPFNNLGVIGGANGGSLVVGGNCVNSGSLSGTSGSVNITGIFTNLTNVTLSEPVAINGYWDNRSGQVVIGGTGSLTMNGGTILGGTVFATNGAALVASGSQGTLDGVSVVGVLDVGRTVNGAALTVTNGLVLNGTAYVGHPSMSWYGRIDFLGSQTLSGNGTVIFGAYSGSACSGDYYNALRVLNEGTSLTLGPGITVRGQYGTIGYDCVWGGPQNVGVINQGAIWADVGGGSIKINGQPFSNLGMIGGVNGGTLVVGGTCTNSGNLGGTSGSVNIVGTFVNQTNVTFTEPVAISGYWDNRNGQVVIGGTGSLTMNGGTILGGTVFATNGAALVASGSQGTLDGVAINGVLDVGRTVNGAALTVTNGLVLNGTAYVGHPNISWYGRIDFLGSQTLSGNGTVIFGAYSGSACSGDYYNALRLINGSTSLTLGSGITVRGQYGTIGYDCVYGGPQNVVVTNQGTILADVVGGTIKLNAQPFQNLGSMATAGGVFSGGVVKGAITVTNGNPFVVGSLTLDGVTFNGVLDVGSTVNGAVLTVTNGLVLNGTAYVGHPSIGWYGRIDFLGSQTLSGNGTVIFGACNSSACSGDYYNALRLLNGGTSLTLAPGITVRGQYGTIGYDCVWGGPQNVGVINQGAIWADVGGGSIKINGQPFSNLGVIGGANGGTLAVGGTCTNGGSLGGTSGSVNIVGTFVNQTNLILNEYVGINGYWDNRSGQVVIGGTGSLTMNGGTILGGTVFATNGAALVASGSQGTLDGVSVVGVLDVGRTVNGAVLTVTNGLVLNGTAYVGHPSMSWYGRIEFLGSQTLSGNGTVIFGACNSSACNGDYYNALRVLNGDSSLTLAPGIMVRGQYGTIGYLCGWGGPQNVGLINQGAIWADVGGGSIKLNGQPFCNLGVIGGANGGTLVVGGTCTNSGNLGGTSGSVNIVGTFVNQTNVTFTEPVAISGYWDNRSGQVVIGGTGSLTMNGGTILGGTVFATNGAALVASGSQGTLDGVAINGVLDVGRIVNGAVLTVTNGLVLNGTAYVGHPSMSWYGRIEFLGSQTLSGNGTVVFGNCSSSYYDYYNALRVVNGGTSLTLAPGITVRGQYGTIGFVYPYGGPQNVGLINQGAISADVGGGSIRINAVGLANQGTLQALGGGQLAIQAAVTNAGQINPGLTPNNIGLTGSFLQTTNGVLNVQIAGPRIGIDFNQLAINGPATLDGIINVQLLNGFMPAVGATFSVLSFNSHAGGFSSVAGDGNFSLQYSPTNVILLAQAVQPPSITQQPQSMTVPLGSNAVFSVTAGGTKPFCYQWYFQRTNTLGGVNDACLALCGVRSTNAGDYFVIVNNSAGSATSAVAHLTVTLPSAPRLGALSSALHDGFRLAIYADEGQSYVLQTSTNLVDWLPLTNLLCTNSTTYFLDATATNYNKRFYRAVTP